jgi:L,D-transpeptidase catalytic domain/Putative peptidoglycan binding domain
MFFIWITRCCKLVSTIFLALNLILFENILSPTENRVMAKELSATNTPPIHTQKDSYTYHIVIDTLKRRMTVMYNGQRVRTFPIAIGTEDTPTPIGEWSIVSKSRNWGSGFGTRWMGLDVPWGLYGIHGTNKPYSIGNKASHGCVRMFNRDVESLFQMIPIGTKVTITGYILGPPWGLPRRLVEGERGPDVMLIQQRLKYTGFFTGQCNGIFRKDMEYALRKFQLANHISPDRNVSLLDYQAIGLEE